MRYIQAAMFAAAVAVLAGVSAQPARADISFDFAYSNLNQHGSWLVSGQYGRVWQPREYHRDWNPYYDGHWVDTDMGWTWVSDYEWGSVPYHYGTWVSDSRYGWVWIPGDVWAPSWVVFRTSPEYIGWAPVPPGFSVGVSVEFGAPSSFIFVSSRDFLAPRVRAAIIPSSRTNVFINNTTIINNIVIQNNIVVNRGPDVRIIERATGRPVRRQPIEQVTRVAPFEHVSRSQLAVAPERVKRGLRVAEPVPESRPLPVADKRGSSSPAAERQQERKTQVDSTIKARETQQRANEQKAADAQKSRRDQAPSNQAEQRQQERKAQADASARARDTQQRSNEQAAADGQKARRDQSERKTQADASARARDTQQRSNEQAAGNARKARDAQPPPREAAPAPSNDAQNKAKAEDAARAKAKAKPKPDAKKKDNPDKQDSGKKDDPGT